VILQKLHEYADFCGEVLTLRIGCPDASALDRPVGEKAIQIPSFDGLFHDEIRGKYHADISFRRFHQSFAVVRTQRAIDRDRRLTSVALKYPAVPCRQVCIQQTVVFFEILRGFGSTVFAEIPTTGAERSLPVQILQADERNVLRTYHPRESYSLVGSFD